MEPEDKKEQTSQSPISNSEHPLPDSKNQIPPDILNILNDIPEPARDRVMAALFIKQTTSSFRSPIPPPEILKGYNDIIPDGANRILVMAEDQSKHRIGIERKVITEQMNESRRGQIFGFLLGIFGLSVSAYLGTTGHDWLAGTIGSTTIISLVTIFVLGKKQQQESIDSKAP